MKPLAALCALASLLLSPMLALAADPGINAIDDAAVDDRILSQIQKLTEEKRAVKGSVLMEQLQRTRCHLSLPEASAKEPISKTDFYNRIRRSVVVLAAPYHPKKQKRAKMELNTAAGFILNQSGVVVTNYHVVIKNESLFALTAEGEVLPVKEVLAANEADDVAIVQLDGGESIPPLPLAPAESPAPVGSAVRVISHPDGNYWSLTEGVLSRYFIIDLGEKLGRVPSMAITADFARGSSGGPVLDESGSVVGMVASTRSIYYDEHKGQQEDLQMVIKECVPAASIWKLIEK
jgi:S1-C subfamily serine protease